MEVPVEWKRRTVPAATLHGIKSSEKRETQLHTIGTYIDAAASTSTKEETDMRQS